MELDLLWAFLIHIREATFDQMHRAIVEKLKVVAREKYVFPVVEAEPFHILLDGFHVLSFLFIRVRIVKAEVAFAIGKFTGDAEIQADRFRMTEVEKAVWLRRKAGDRAFVFPGGKISSDDFSDEIGFWRVRHAGVVRKRGKTRMKWQKSGVPANVL